MQSSESGCEKLVEPKWDIAVCVADDAERKVPADEVMALANGIASYHRTDG